MADAVEDMYLGNLDEFVNDEDKIVTYKWLSRTLSVHVNKAKQMLYAFAQKQKSEKSSSHLDITYIVGGRCLIDGEMVHRYVIAVDEKLEETKKSFSPVTSLHIYSIQKSKLKDSNALYTVDYGIQQEYKSQNNGWSHIYCPAAQPLAGDMTGSGGDLKTSLGNADDRTSVAKMVNGTSEHVTSISHSSKVSSHVRADQKSKVSLPKAKKGPMSALEMFAAKSSTSKAGKNSQNKKSTTSTDAATEDSEVDQKKTGSNNPGSKKSFFGISTTDKKASEKPSTTAKENETHPAKAETEVKQTPCENTQGKKKSNKGLKKKAVIYESDEEHEEKPKKRRKRMRELPDEDGSDNESNLAKVKTDVKVSSDQGSSRSESPLPQQQLAQLSDRETTRRRKRRRTARSKTYMNDDGFMVTEKVWESESTDASDEEPMIVKSTNDKPPSPRIAGKTNHQDIKNKAVKQASLKSFFKKS